MSEVCENGPTRFANQLFRGYLIRGLSCFHSSLNPTRSLRDTKFCPKHYKPETLYRFKAQCLSTKPMVHLSKVIRSDHKELVVATAWRSIYQFKGNTKPVEGKLKSDRPCGRGEAFLHFPYLVTGAIRIHAGFKFQYLLIILKIRAIDKPWSHSWYFDYKTFVIQYVIRSFQPYPEKPKLSLTSLACRCA